MVCPYRLLHCPGKVELAPPEFLTAPEGRVPPRPMSGVQQGRKWFRFPRERGRPRPPVSGKVLGAQMIRINSDSIRPQ